MSDPTIAFQRLRTSLLLATALPLCAASSLAQAPNAAQARAPARPSDVLTPVARFEHQVTGVTVAKDGWITAAGGLLTVGDIRSSEKPRFVR